MIRYIDEIIGELQNAGQDTQAGGGRTEAAGTAGGEHTEAAEAAGAGHTEAAEAAGHTETAEAAGAGQAGEAGAADGERTEATDGENTEAGGDQDAAAGEQSGAGGEMTGDDSSEGTHEEAGEDGQEEGPSEETLDAIISDNGETVAVFQAEPETAYVTATPADTDTISRTHSSVAEVVSKTAHNAAESAVPAMKSIAFNLVNAIIIMFIGVQVARLLRKMLRDALGRMHMDESLQSFLSSVIYVLTCGVSAFVALERLGVSSASIVAILGSAGLAISLSLQDFLGNFAGGIIIMTLKPFHAGDYIVCDSMEGTVAATGLFYTTLRTVDNRQVILPNGKLANAEIINVTAEARRRLEIAVTISYESDLRRAKDILKRLFDECPDIYHDEELLLFVSDLGEDGVVLKARGWIDQDKYWTARWAITEQLKLAYDEAGIEIPYRQMDVYLSNKETKKGSGN